jgi:hypothetical protein
VVKNNQLLIIEKDVQEFLEIGPKKTLLNFLPKSFEGEININNELRGN